MKKMLTVCAIAALVAGCGQREREPEAAPPAVVPAQFVSRAPEGTATPIPEARKLQPGADVLLEGKVMGVHEPFVEARALFVLGDEATITPCNAMAEPDHCPTPWDACCDAAEVRSAGTASVQLLGEDGNVLAMGLRGVKGLKELSRVTVAGKVAPASTPEAFIVNASALFVAP